MQSQMCYFFSVSIICLFLPKEPRCVRIQAACKIVTGYLLRAQALAGTSHSTTSATARR